MQWVNIDPNISLKFQKSKEKEVSKTPQKEQWSYTWDQDHDDNKHLKSNTERQKMAKQCDNNFE
jgi:hypothetical protein